MANNVNAIAWKPDHLLTQNLIYDSSKKIIMLCDLEKTNKQRVASPKQSFPLQDLHFPTF